ncbi:MAG TPA: DUF692 family protein [Bacillota bacterium]|nr:DUF692 family protein [Bacillota bacterium]
MRFLACNYLLESLELLNEKAVKFDYFKYPSLFYDVQQTLPEFIAKLERIVKVKPVLFHGLFPNQPNICNPRFQESFNSAAVKEIYVRSCTPGISFHFDGAAVDVGREELVKTAITNVLYLKEMFAEAQFVAIENPENRPNPWLVDPEVISEVIQATKTSLLLDISHANRSAGERGETLWEYISKLPMDHIQELHLNGWVIHNQQQMGHLKIQAELYEFIKKLINDFPVKVVTLEYGREIDKLGAGCPLVNVHQTNPKAKEEIREQLLRLAEMVY